MIGMEGLVHTDDRWARKAGLLLGAVIAVVVFTTAVRLNAHDLYRVLGVGGDAWGYYQYVATLFGSHRFTQLPWTHHLDGDLFLSMFTCGVAYLQAPWALVGHGLAWATGSPMDGYSAPYAVALMGGMAVYMAIASNLLFHALRRRFPMHIALAVPLLLLAGTNLFFYAVRQPAMSHAYVYLLFCVMLYLVERNLEKPSPWRTGGILITCSLAVLVRQLHVIVVLFPLLYLVPDASAFRARLRWLTLRPSITIGCLLLAVGLWLPQLAYWQAVTGHWFIFPYGYKGEHFDHLLAPRVGEVLWGVRNGWLIYSPVLLLAVGGLCWSAWYKLHGARTILAIHLLVLFSYAAWWCWWLGGAFGHRGFVDYYGLLSIPLAWTLARMVLARWWVRAPALVFVVLTLVLNLRMTERYQWFWSEPDWTWARLSGEWASLF